MRGSIHEYVTEQHKGSQRSISEKDTGHSTKNLPGGKSAVVPPDPMPNSEVKRRSADGSVGSPHARVGNCQASNKTDRPSSRMAFLLWRVIRKVRTEGPPAVRQNRILQRHRGAGRETSGAGGEKRQRPP